MALYNTTRYNEQSFNYLQLSEVVPMSDAATKEINPTVSDIVFTNDNLTKQVTGKIVNEEIKLTHWLQINNKPSSTWSD